MFLYVMKDYAGPPFPAGLRYWKTLFGGDDLEFIGRQFNFFVYAA